MLYSTAGSKLYIADVPAMQAGASLAWVEIGSTEAIGMLGVEWDVETADVMNDCGPDDYPGELAFKGVRRRPEMPIILGNDPTDAGQLLLWTAARAQDGFPFRLVFPGGEESREWLALVIRIGEVFDTANSVMKLQVDLKPVSPITRNGGELL